MSQPVYEERAGDRLERVRISDAELTEIEVEGARLRRVAVTAAQVRGSSFDTIRMRGVELIDVEINGELERVIVNGVDVAPLIDAELDRRTPDRAKMQPERADGFRQAWAILATLWEQTIARARSLPEPLLHRSVDDEWSFIQTLRHLNFASAAWVDRMILGVDSPWHPLDLPWDEAPGWDGIPWDRDATPSLDEVLEVRASRRATATGVIAALSDEQLATTVTRTAPGWPSEAGFALKQCLRIVLNEEWEHRLYAERDLTALEGGG